MVSQKLKVREARTWPPGSPQPIFLVLNPGPPLHNPAFSAELSESAESQVAVTLCEALNVLFCFSPGGNEQRDGADCTVLPIQTTAKNSNGINPHGLWSSHHPLLEIGPGCHQQPEQGIVPSSCSLRGSQQTGLQFRPSLCARDHLILTGDSAGGTVTCI